MKTDVYVCNVDPSYIGAQGDAPVFSDPSDAEPLESPSFNWDRPKPAPREDNVSEDLHEPMHTTLWDWGEE